MQTIVISSGEDLVQKKDITDFETILSKLYQIEVKRYFHTLLSNREILHTYYDDCALLRDDEKNSMLPNMAAGLGSILFAVSIDKPELNSESTLQKSQRLKAHPEPIIEAPIHEQTKSRKKNYRVSKQLISFNDDDSVLSSSLPSSSSSIISEIKDLTKSTANMECKVDVFEVHSSIKDDNKPERKLSLKKSGSSDKFAIDGTITPVDQSSVGELTPICVEKSCLESPNTSDEIIEVPADISAILTAVELRNKEEISKLCERINNLTRENEQLKEQINKYVSAIQMLRHDEVSLNKALEDLELEPTTLPDYKSEAQMFEKKLVQVAEMHAELMGFNVHLQETLCAKDTLLDRLTKELEDLRGPVPLDELSEEPNVNIWIPSAFLTGTGSDTHHVYQIFLRAGVDEWNIYRRYSQFYSLHTDLKKLDSTISTFNFPPKKSIGKKDSTLVEDRRKRLQTYLRRILSHWPELSHCNSKFLLEQHLAFFKDPKPNEDRSKRNAFSSKRNATNTNDNHYTGL